MTNIIQNQINLILKKVPIKEDYNIEDNNWSRNTFPYNLRDKNLKYPYIDTPETLDASAIVSSASKGNIQSIIIKTPGDSYKVGDNFNFDNGLTSGFCSCESIIIERKTCRINSNRYYKN